MKLVVCVKPRPSSNATSKSAAAGTEPRFVTVRLSVPVMLPSAPHAVAAERAVASRSERSREPPVELSVGVPSHTTLPESSVTVKARLAGLQSTFQPANVTVCDVPAAKGSVPPRAVNACVTSRPSVSVSRIWKSDVTAALPVFVSVTATW